MSTLVLTEKPSVARDFAKALEVGGKRSGYFEGSGYVVTWAIGHLLELAEPEDYHPRWRRWSLESLPILPERLRHRPIAKVARQLEVIQKLLQRPDVETIIIATDAGREGEVIARTILSTVGDLGKGVARFWTSQALTAQVIRESLAAVRPAAEYDRLWHAGQARQIADWLVGMNLSRAATLKFGRPKDVFSVGRVQTAVLALLVDRRREREQFRPEPYWLLRVRFSAPAREGAHWWGTWFQKDSSRFPTKADADAVIERVHGQSGTVRSVKRERKKQPPPPLFSLTDLQREANTRHGLSAKHTLDVAQRLYEEKKCLSYPRTDARVLGSKNVALVLKLIEKLRASYPELFQGVDRALVTPANRRVFNDARLTDHHALIPLAPLPAAADPNERRVYDLVLKRFAAAFHPDHHFEATEIVTEVAKERFRSRGRRPLVAGWKGVYGAGEGLDATGQGDEPEEVDLPLVEKGDAAKVEDLELNEKTTQPPPEYTEAGLLKDMTSPSRYVSEEQLRKVFKGDVGLGTQATRAQIIETLIGRRYVERRKKQLMVTDKGCFLIDSLRKLESSKVVTAPEETARWELELERIARGEGDQHGFLSAIRRFVERAVGEFKRSARQKMGSRKLGKCPECGGEVIEGRKGYGCSNWRETDGGCRFVVWKEIAGQQISPEQATNLLAGEPTDFMPFRHKDGRAFSAALKLEREEEQGRWTVRFVGKDKGGGEARGGTQAEPDGEIEALGNCPRCGGPVREGRKGYGCGNWRREDGGCPFVIWKEIARKRITPEMVRDLLERGETGLMTGFISKKGKEFRARLKVEGKDCKITFGFD